MASVGLRHGRPSSTINCCIGRPVDAICGDRTLGPAWRRRGRNQHSIAGQVPIACALMNSFKSREAEKAPVSTVDLPGHTKLTSKYPLYPVLEESERTSQSGSSRGRPRGCTKYPDLIRVKGSAANEPYWRRASPLSRRCRGSNILPLAGHSCSDPGHYFRKVALTVVNHLPE
jgi:hypothetical protein